ncbi:uncharacterized protein BT62DRAFT_1008788 [Guyanagaster necrorhizus]|uniref:Uncharacterized protein n=1 Tax=Guyanagaster necrorhizus TaxID=856835 RepID=A0A9P7VPP4_9AGAR|nr:uncharacterized protein BT62DRAFT_1008788 [Guyanagaster necrorhizus MCA 3950]KAG7443729.1 hypothetical protein BT62DRAFT_1008788 [Guyanagaster necrorhizus MCA 3950]
MSKLFWWPFIIACASSVVSGQIASDAPLQQCSYCCGICLGTCVAMAVHGVWRGGPMCAHSLPEVLTPILPSTYFFGYV